MEQGDPSHHPPRRSPLEVLRREPLILLRAFLGVTFVVAGLQKLDNPGFFKANGIGSFVEQTRSAVSTSPIAPLLRLALHVPTAVALIIAICEVAVGLGTLLGLLGRAAAIGGLLLSLTFFLSISYATTPYYYGSDIVFVFAWTALIFSGPGKLSLDGLAKARLASDLEKTNADNSTATKLTRRAVLERLTTIASATTAGAMVSGLIVEIARGKKQHVASTLEYKRLPPSKDVSSEVIPPRSKRVASIQAVPVGGAVAFSDESQGVPAYVLQPEKDSFVAFSRICTHAGCTVVFNNDAEQFDCPCHGSIYDAKTGAVVRGPAPMPLAQIALEVVNGVIYTSH